MPNGNDEKPSGNKWAVMGGIALNVEYTRKYAFEATAAARVTARLVAIPPPAAFQEAVQADIAGRQRRAALLAAQTATGATTVADVELAPPPLSPPPLLEPAEMMIEEGESLWGDDEEMFSLLVPEAAGVEYTLDDGIAPPSAGRVGADGVLTHHISPHSHRVVLQFANRAQPVTFFLDRTDDEEVDDIVEAVAIAEDLLEFEQFGDEPDEDEPDEDELDEDEVDDDWLDDDGFVEDDLDDADLDDEDLDDEFDEADWADEEAVEEITVLSTEDETPTLSLLVPEKANQPYTLDDGVNPPRDGVVDADGLLVHPVSPEATLVSLKFADEAEAIQLSLATE